MKKNYIKGLCSIIIIGVLFSVLIETYFNNNTKVSSDKSEPQQFTNVTETVLSNNRTLIDKMKKPVKLPTEVIFSDTEINQANKFHSINFNEMNNGVLEYKHFYSSKDKRQSIMFHVLDSPNQEIQIGNMMDTHIEEVKLNNGITATFANEGSVQVLSFTEPETHLVYSLIGQKKDGEFTKDEFISIAQSIK
jgi:hypothetical protein